MYKVNDELWINLKFVSAVYKTKMFGWRIAVIGSENCIEYSLTNEDAQNIIDALKEYNK